jgi:hypothetical protein
MPEGLAGLTSGALDAVVLSPPSNFKAAKSGMHELVDVSQLGIVFPNTPLSTTVLHPLEPRDRAALSAWL